MGTYICSYVSTRGPMGGNRRPYPLRECEVGCKTLKQSKTLKQIVQCMGYAYKSLTFLKVFNI